MSATITNCWQSLQFYVSKPFSPPETVDTKACPNYQIVAKVNTKFQKSLKLRLLRCVRVRRLLVAYAGADTSHPKKIYRSALVPQVCKGFLYHSLAGPARRPMGSRCSRPALRAPLGIRAYGQQSRRTGNGVSKSAPNPCKY